MNKRKNVTRTIVTYAIYAALIFTARTLDHLISGWLPINFAIVTLAATFSCAFIRPSLANCFAVGTIFGMTSFITTFMFGGNTIIYGFANPLISVAPRMLVGLALFGAFAFCFHIMNKLKAKRSVAFIVSIAVACVIAALVNTVTVLTMIWLFKTIEGLDALYVIFTANAIPELIVPAVITPFVVSGVRRSMKVKDKYNTEENVEQSKGETV